MTQRRANIFLAVAGIVLVFGALWHYVWMSGDGWWYLALGREIFLCKCLPEFNDLIFTGRWTHVLHQQWLPYVVYYSAYKIGGYWAVYAFTAAMIVCGFAATLFASRSRGASGGAWLMLALAGIYSFRLGFSVRSESLIYLFFGLELLIIERARAGKKSPLWLMPILFMLWANSHSSLPLAIVYPLVVAAGWWADNRTGEQARGLKNIFLWLAVSMVATLINPYGWGIYTDVAGRLASRSTDIIEIFQSPNFHDPYNMAQGAWMLLMWAGLLITPRRPSYTDLAVASVTSLMFLSAQRYFIFMLMATLPVATSHWSEIAKRFERPFWNVLLASLSLVLGLYLLAAPRHFLDVEADVRDASEFMEKNHVSGHVFNYYTWGGYLLWEHPEMEWFIDGRNNIYEPSGVFDDYRLAARGGRFWKEVFDVYEINAVIWPTFEPGLLTALLNDPAWRLVYNRGEAAVFLRAQR